MDRLLSRAEMALLGVAAAGLVFMMGHVTLEVMLRVAGQVSQLQTITFVSAWYMIAVVFCAMPYAEREEGHIRVDIITATLPPALRRGMQRVFCGVVAICLGFMAWFSGVEALDKTLEGEIWETSSGYFPVWPGRWAVALAFSALAMRNLLRFAAGAGLDERLQKEEV